MDKEIKHCKNVEDLSCNDAVKHKAKDYIKKYMARFGSVYKANGENERGISPKETVSQDSFE